jgi:hypothetical protein
MLANLSADCNEHLTHATSTISHYTRECTSHRHAPLAINIDASSATSAVARASTRNLAVFQYFTSSHHHDDAQSADIPCNMRDCVTRAADASLPRVSNNAFNYDRRYAVNNCHSNRQGADLRLAVAYECTRIAREPDARVGCCVARARCGCDTPTHNTITHTPPITRNTRTFLF